AHPDVFNMLLQIMEEGRLTDSFGRHVDFKNVILIMTSNIGADMIKNQVTLGFQKTSEDRTYEGMKKMLESEVEKHFRPEFVNRVDDIIVFHSLNREDMKVIIDIELKDVKKRLAGQGLEFSLTDEAKEFVIDKGYNPDFGARPLRRAIERLIEDPLSEAILKNEFGEKKHIRVRVRDRTIFFDPFSTEEEAVAADELHEKKERPAGEVERGPVGFASGAQKEPAR
ncbi:MAG: ATP-dependent Clp protease ATP-binding subunit, partial [Planctomycetes bacterium]|nr:ATP-dependent Clp protease ATP-binding subunit [Planctomycetota bacterium]